LIPVDSAVIARIDKHGKRFEILVDPEKALEIRRGKSIPLDEVVAYEEVFEDSSKGLRASEEDMKKVFGTSEFEKVAIEIIRKGSVQLTTEQRRRMREEITKQVADIISRKSVNPQTGAPHPPQRIITAMSEAGVHVDEMLRAEEQVERIVKALKPILPISMETVRIQFIVPPQYTGRAYGKIKEFGSLVKESWKNDGSWEGVIEIPAGLQGDFYELIGSLTKGEARTKVMEK